jgi:hypothetical protein
MYIYMGIDKFRHRRFVQLYHGTNTADSTGLAGNFH